jgi:Protein of unknown function DUF2834
MTISRKALCVFYALVALVALVGTWGNNVAYLDMGLAAANLHFWQQTLVNPASRSITVDILLLGLAAITWMFLEARRLSMRGVWIYVLASILIAISAAFPAFLIHRELALAAREGTDRAGRLSHAELLALVVLGGAMLAYTLFSLGR